MLNAFTRSAAAMLAATMLTGCGPSPSNEAPAEPTEAPGVVSSRAGQELPPDHPPMNRGDSGIVPPAPGSGTGATGLTWTAPESWIEETPTSGMRRAQYRIPGSGGDAECIVFYFGPGQGGPPQANAVRWASQFKQADGSDPAAAMKSTRIDVGGMPVTLVETSGTYENLMVNDEAFPGYMLLGAIVEGPDANWFFKLTGPEATVNEQREPFEALARSVRSGS